MSAVTTTPEYNLLRENYDKIVSILCQSSDPSSLAERLYSSRLIDKSAMEEASRAGEESAVRFSRLMSDVLAQVENNPRKFDQFVGAMEEWPEAKTLLEQLHVQGGWVCVCVCVCVYVCVCCVCVLCVCVVCVCARAYKTYDSSYFVKSSIHYSWPWLFGRNCLAGPF